MAKSTKWSRRASGMRVTGASAAAYLTALLLLGVAGCGSDDAGTGGAGAAIPAGGSGGQAGSPGGAGGSGGTGGGWDPRFDAFVAQLQADLAASQAYGVSAAVMEGGVVTFAGAFGSKDDNGVVPLTPATLMQIGSTTKQMTATAALRKVEAGLVSLDDTVEAALPQLDFAHDPTWDDQILLRHLLSHQGAIADSIPWGAAATDSLLASYTYGTFASQSYLMNPPGVFWNYSNPNFILAGLITEELDTRAWPDIMRQDVFAPLGMTRTFLRKTEVEADGDYALSYGLGKDDLVSGEAGPVAMTDMPDPAWARPAGLVWTTPSQMMSWAKFIMHGNPAVLSDQLRGEITTEQVDTLYQEGTMHYGFGMFVERGYLTHDGTWYPMTVWEHGGNTLSFTNILYMLPERDFALAICTSAYETDFSRSVDVALTTLVDLPAPGTAPHYVVDPAEFDHHVATYSDPWNVGDVIVTRQGNALFVSMPRLDQYQIPYDPALTAVSSTIFMATIQGAPTDLTFIPIAAGGDSQYIRNRSFVASRTPPVGPTAASYPAAPPSREQLLRRLEAARRAPSPWLRQTAH